MISVKESSLLVEVATTFEDPQWDQFLELAGDNHHQQTARWAKLKSVSGWQVLRLVMRRDDKIVGGVQILHRLMRFVGRVGYAPRGPVIADSDPRLCEQLLAELDRAVRAENFACLMIQPPAVAAHCVALLRARGFHPTPLQVAPTATVLIDLCLSPPEWLAGMSRSTRRSIRASLSGGLNVRVGGEADLPAFHSLLAATGRRHGFTPPPLDYFCQLWRLFAPGSHIVLFLAELAGEPLAGELDISFGDTLVAKRAGWSGQHGKLYPNQRLVWAVLNWAKEHGYKQYDVEGLDPDLARAIASGDRAALGFGKEHYSSKLGFGGQVVVLPENHEYVYRRIAGWAHRNVWLKFAPARCRQKLMRSLETCSWF
jgi:lipid II:glycine glycyltransferase (peptidoglycan interpeptide bridge formation enzyme)